MKFVGPFTSGIAGRNCNLKRESPSEARDDLAKESEIPLIDILGAEESQRGGGFGVVRRIDHVGRQKTQQTSRGIAQIFHAHAAAEVRRVAATHATAALVTCRGAARTTLAEGILTRFGKNGAESRVAFLQSARRLVKPEELHERQAWAERKGQPLVMKEEEVEVCVRVCVRVCVYVCVYVFCVCM